MIIFVELFTCFVVQLIGVGLRSVFGERGR